MKQINFAKLLIFILIFILMSIIFTFLIIIPNIKTYKNMKNKYNKEYLLYQHIDGNFVEASTTLAKFKKKNNKALSALSNKFKEENFIKASEYFFKNVVLKKDMSVLNSDFNVYDLNITMSMKTPEKFYSFIEDLARYENIIQLDFPILMQSHGEVINTFFKIKVFNIEK